MTLLITSNIDNEKYSMFIKLKFYKDSNMIAVPLQTATCFVSCNGLKFTVEDAKCVQGNAFIQAAIFQEYTFKEESATFRINLNVLMVKKFEILSKSRRGV